MTHTFKLARRGARFRAVAFVAAVFGFAACDNADRLGPIASGDGTSILADSSAMADDSANFVDGDTLSDAQLDANEALPEAAFVTTARTARGIAFGPYNLPTSLYGPTFTASAIAAGPSDILHRLEAARRSGARVLVRLSAGERYWLNRNKSVNLSKWKLQIARFKRVNLKPYIKDGTLLGHILIDEPHDKSNWGGRPVPFATLEAMAKYSKQLFPGLTTVVRSYPPWLAGASFRWKYLDAAMAQYTARKGEVSRWMREQSSAARREGLGLIVSLNLLNGGNRASRLRGLYRGYYAMSASQIKSWGTLLATNSMSCGFFFWNYNQRYFGRSDIKAALKLVSAKAKSRSRQSCRM
jgi:hypothetical protein